MEDKFTAVYVMVRMEELTPEEGGSYEGPLAKQKEACLQYVKNRSDIQAKEHVEIYKNLNQLLMDVERQRIRRLVVYNLDRLGSNQKEREGILFELNAAGVDLLAVTE